MSESNASAPAPSSVPAESSSVDLQTSDNSPIMADTGVDVVDSIDSSEEDAPVAETKKEAADRKKKYQLKVNNKVKDVELDLDDDAEVQKYLQKAMAADEKFEEAAMTRKQAEMLVHMIKTNPIAILTHPDIGVDIKALAQKVINDELEDMSKTPEQRKMEEMEKKLKSYEEEKTRLAEEKRQAEMARFEQEQAVALDEQMTQALSSSSLPKSPYVVKRIADAMIEAVNMGYEDVTPEKVMPYVEASMKREMAEMFGSSTDQIVEELVGKGRLDKYRKDRVAKAKATTTPKKVQDTGASAKKEDKKEEKKVKFKDVFGQF